MNVNTLFLSAKPHSVTLEFCLFFVNRSNVFILPYLRPPWDAPLLYLFNLNEDQCCVRHMRY